MKQQQYKAHTHIVALRRAWLLLLLLQLCSCERRPMVEPEESVAYAEISVRFDWALARMNPTGMTAIFYPTDGGKAVVHKTGDNPSTVRLRPGTYHVVGFNYSFDEFDGILFRGTDRYETIEAYAQPLPDLTTRAGTAVTDVVAHPDVLATDYREAFDVTPEMVAQTNATRAAAAQVVLTPLRVTAPGYVTIHLKGLNYIRSANGVITGLSRSVFLAGRQPSTLPCALAFGFTRPTYYSGSKVNGTLEGTFTTFGMLPPQVADARYGLLFSSVLTDKEQTPFEQRFDVTGAIRQEMDVNLNILLRLNLELGMSQTPGDDTPTIEVPKVEPEVGGAFDVDVSGWGDEENVFL